MTDSDKELIGAVFRQLGFSFKMDIGMLVRAAGPIVAYFDYPIDLAAMYLHNSNSSFTTEEIAAALRR